MSLYLLRWSRITRLKNTSWSNGCKAICDLLATTLITAALLASPLWASDGGTLLGTVSDPSGRPVAGAQVAAIETATGVRQAISTDGRGFYSFQSLSVGHYDVEVIAAGFKPVR